jgi:uncharacterized membrane protein
MLLWCGALLSCMMSRTADNLSRGLVWNLFLAFLPLLFSAAFQTASAKRRHIAASAYFFLWLLFLPNAPYILTDLFHLSPRPNVPLWFMLALLLSCAGTGTLLGYLSLIKVQSAVNQRFGKAIGWAVAVCASMLCGFGIYLGRFLRWNSWDALAHPFQLVKTVIHQFINPGPHPSPLSVTLVFGSGLLIGYIALYVVAASIRNEIN